MSEQDKESVANADEGTLTVYGTKVHPWEGQASVPGTDLIENELEQYCVLQPLISETSDTVAFVLHLGFRTRGGDMTRTSLSMSMEGALNLMRALAGDQYVCAEIERRRQEYLAKSEEG